MSTFVPIDGFPDDDRCRREMKAFDDYCAVNIESVGPLVETWDSCYYCVRQEQPCVFTDGRKGKITYMYRRPKDKDQEYPRTTRFVIWEADYWRQDEEAPCQQS